MSSSIIIHEVQRKRRTVLIAYAKGAGTFDLEEPDNPLPSFGKAFDDLLPLVAIILHLPEDWLTNCRVVGVKFGEQGGARTAALLCRKGLDDAAKEFAFLTPERLLAHPTDPGSYTPPLTLHQAELINAVDEEARKYVRGERAQGEIPFDDVGGEVRQPDDRTTNQLPLGEGAPPADAPVSADTTATPPEPTAEPKAKTTRKRAKKGGAE